MPYVSPNEQWFPMLRPTNLRFLKPNANGDRANRFIPMIIGMQDVEEGELPPYRPKSFRRWVPKLSELEGSKNPYVVNKSFMTVIWPFIKMNLILIPLFLGSLIFSLSNGRYLLMMLFFALLLLFELLLLGPLQKRNLKWFSNVVLVSSEDLTIRRDVYPTKSSHFEAQSIKQASAQITGIVRWLPMWVQTGFNIGTVEIVFDGDTYFDQDGLAVSDNKLTLRYVHNPKAVAKLINQLAVSFERKMKGSVDADLEAAQRAQASALNQEELLEELATRIEVLNNLTALGLLQQGVNPDQLIHCGMNEDEIRYHVSAMHGVSAKHPAPPTGHESRPTPDSQAEVTGRPAIESGDSS